MDARPTLVSEGPFGNALPASSMPPPSAMKKPAPRPLGRPSMLSQPSSRLSVMPGGGGGMGQPTLSHSASQETLRRSNMGQARPDIGGMGMMSGSRGDGGMYGRTSQANRNPPGSVRRSSVYTSNSGRQSMAAGALPPNNSKETRPIRDRTFQSQCSTNVADYLTSRHCPVSWHPKLLSSPTSKEFQQMFRFLVRDYTDPSSWGKKFEDDAQVILKDLRYPSMETVGKTAMSAPGSQTSWIPLLAMFNWLVELNKAHERWFDPEVISDPLLLPANELPLDHPLLEDRAFYNYAATTYRQWWHEGGKDFPEADMEYEQIYDRMVQASYDESDQLETSVKKRRAELQHLQAQEPPLKKAEEEYIQLMGDQAKFHSFIGLHKQKAEKIRIATERARSTINDTEAQIEAAKIELARTEEAVAAQNLSPDEVNRMNHDRETLSRTIDDLKTKIAEASQHAYDQEMQVTKSMDRFEQLQSDYIALAHQIGTIRPLFEGPGPDLGPNGVDYTINLDLGAEDVGEVQNEGAKMRNSILPALQKLGEDLRLLLLDLGNEQIALEHQYDKQVQTVDRMKGKVENQETDLKIKLGQAEDAKNTLQHDMASTNQIIADMENKVLAIGVENQKSILACETELEEKTMEYQELRHKTAHLQETMLAELGRHIEVIVKAKEHTANTLKGLRAFAESIEKTKGV